jgi:hypothetical protein
MIPTRAGHPFWMYEELQATPDALDCALAPAAAETLDEDDTLAAAR